MNDELLLQTQRIKLIVTWGFAMLAAFVGMMPLAFVPEGQIWGALGYFAGGLVIYLMFMAMGYYAKYDGFWRRALSHLSEPNHASVKELERRVEQNKTVADGGEER